MFADDTPKPTPEDGTAGAPAEDEPKSGTDYMHQRKSERDARWSVDEELHDACVAIHDQLSSMTADSLTAPLQRPEVSGHTGQMLLNGVYLVATADLDPFRTEVYELADEFAAVGVAVELTGPWPPYNFVSGSIEAAR